MSAILKIPLMKKYKDAAVDLIQAAGVEDVNARNADGVTPLMFAVGMGQVSIVELLLSKGADIHAKNKDGMCALMAAVSRGKPMDHIADLLVRHGADADELAQRYPKAQSYLNRKHMRSESTKEL
jgi:ankyrin repeat protein